MTEQSLYERLGGDFAIAAVVDRFSDQLLKNPKIVNANPQLKKWHTEEYKTRLAGLKFLRTLWVCAVAGGPFQYTGKPLKDAHFDLNIPAEVRRARCADGIRTRVDDAERAVAVIAMNFTQSMSLRRRLAARSSNAWGATSPTHA